MMQAFTRNYEDNSTDAGFQFTFYCDVCHDGFRSSFIESQTYKKGNLLRGLSRGIGAASSLLGGGVLGEAQPHGLRGRACWRKVSRHVARMAQGA